MTRAYLILKLILITFLLSAGYPMEILAQDASSEPLRNPFIPQLPKPKIETPIIPIPRDEFPQQVQIQPAPPPALPQRPPTVVITGLIWDSDRPQAIVNGQVVDVGDKISEMEIVSIDKTGIDFIFNGETITISP